MNLKILNYKPMLVGVSCIYAVKIMIMATVYKVEVVSHWISYSKEELEKILTEAVKKIERKKGNEIQIHVEERK